MNSRKLVSIALTLTTALWLVGPVAGAQTTASIQAQIAQLMAQIQALQSQLNTSGGSTTSMTFTQNLTVGSKGTQVSSLQQVLISAGNLTIAAPTGYFGPATKAALVAWQKAHNVSPASGYFGPLTRAAMSGTTVTTSGGTVVSVPAGSSLAVSISPNNPVAGNVPVNPASGSEVVPMLRVNFTAGSAPVTVTSLTVQRSGLSSDQDLSNVYLKYYNGPILATNLGITNGAVNFNSPAGLFTVPAGQTVEITVAASIVSSATGHTYLFSIPSAASVVTLGSQPVSGSFPVTGNTMTSASVTNLGGLQITNASAGFTGTSASGGLQVNAGQTQFQIGQFTFQAQNQPIQVNSVTFTLTGSVGNSDVQNFNLYNGGTLLQNVPGLSTGNTIVFNNVNLQMASGQSAIFNLFADIPGGVNRNFQVSIQHNYDVSTKDMMFNIGFIPSLLQSAGGNASLNTFPAYGSFVSVSQGTLTVSKDTNSPSNYVLPGGTNQTIAKIDFMANGEAVRVTGLTVALSGTMTIPVQLNNVKVVDDLGTQIGTTAVTPVGANTTLSNLNYVVAANTTRVLSVVADVASAATGTLTAALNTITGQGYTSLAAITNAGQSGNQLTASTNVLTATQNSALGSVNVVSGQVGARIASFALTAGAASAVSVSNVQITVASSTDFQNLKVMVGSAQLGTTQGTLTNSTYTFSASTPYQIAAGGQLIVDVYSDVKTNVGTGTALGVVYMTPTAVSAVAVSTNQPITSIASSNVISQTVNVVAAGTLSYAATNMPAGIQVGMGTTGVQLAQYTITGSNNEAINVQNVWITSTSSLPGALVNFRLQDSNGIYYPATGGNNLNGTSSPYVFEFVGVNIPIAQGGQLGLKLIADANTYGNLSATYTSAATVTALVNQLDFQGKASQQTASATSTSYSNTFTVLRTSLSGATASGQSFTPNPSNQLIGAYTFTAGPGANVSLSSTTVALLVANASSSVTSSTLTVYNTSTGQNVGFTSSASPTTNILDLGATTTVTFTTPVTINAGTSVTLQFFSNLTGFTTKPANSNTSITATLNLYDWRWSDGTATSLAPNPSYNLPSNVIPGATAPVVIVQ